MMFKVIIYVMLICMVLSTVLFTVNMFL
ncbi:MULTISPECIES: stressosome-associated protein Prli42 [Paenibacillus]|uniref:Stressosome-associated protein Prli42 n=1 Tax=Paenibacillus vulneris TaxID=1133364 RepID=A0ABW3UWS7_9BACL|nr:MULTISPECIES: stressosome-associated protein Prli42 [unclassified Paenibacillus]